MAKWSAIFSLFLCFCLPWLSAKDTLTIALQEYERAIAGSADAVEATQHRLKQLLRADPGNALARAYLGNTYILKARDAPLLSKRRWAARGFAELDAAVTESVGDHEVRLVRAVNAYNLPRLLQRHSLAQEDFQILLEAVRNEPATLTDELRKEILFHAGAFALKEDASTSIFLLEEALNIPVASPLDRNIQTMLRLARNRFQP